MKTWVVLCCWLLSCRAACGQTSSFRLLFKFSRVVLANNDTLAGTVAVQFAPDILCLTLPDGTARAFEPKDVAAFAVQGEISLSPQGRPLPQRSPDPTVLRLFRTVCPPAEHPGAPVKPGFFEQLSAGPVLLLRRQYLAQRLIAYATPPTPTGAGGPGGSSGRNQPPPTPPRYMSLTDLRDSFFLARSPNDLAPLRPALREVQAAFPAQAQELQVYARAQHLSLSTARDLADLVGYANSLAQAAAR